MRSSDLHYELIDSFLGLVPTLPPQVDAQSLLATMKRDNKKTGDSLRFVLLNGLGSCANEEGDYLVTIPDNAYILDFVGRFLDAYPERPRRAVNPTSARSATLAGHCQGQGDFRAAMGRRAY